MVGAGANCRPVTVSTRKAGVAAAVVAEAEVAALPQTPVSNVDGHSVISGTSTDDGPPDMEALQIGRILNAMEAAGSAKKATAAADSGVNGKNPNRKSWVVVADKESFKVAGKKGREMEEVHL